MEKCVDELNKKAYDILYGKDGKAMDHMYPNENLVRLERWYFVDGAGKRAFDHGFGSGENLLHLLRRGYEVEGADISSAALNLVKEKIEKNNHGNAHLKLLSTSDHRLPYSDNSFDFIISMGVLEYLPSKNAVSHTLNELHRILKPGGKMILSTAGKGNQFCQKGQSVSENVYLYQGKEGHDNQLVEWKMYIFQDEVHVREVFDMFKIDDVGWFDNHYCNRSGFHYVVLARK